MTEYCEEDWFMLSALDKYVFCPRQFALIHIEDQWAENEHTVTGSILHERAHEHTGQESRGDKVIERAVRVFSPTLGVSGECDVVEFVKSEIGTEIKGREGFWRPVPVEYKKGRPGNLDEDDQDVVQLCCQGMCLSEMLACDVLYGYLYYFEVRRRYRVDFTESLQGKVCRALSEMHRLYERRYTPVVKRHKGCRSCSLCNICMPEIMKQRSVKNYIDEYVG